MEKWSHLGSHFLAVIAHNNSSSSWPSLSHLVLKGFVRAKGKSTELFHCPGQSPEENIFSDIPGLALLLFGREDPEVVYEQGPELSLPILPPQQPPNLVVA